ncbi:MAG TPA: glycoside hydrolase family 3 N-terminal domain-containing protein [Blastocatellia bacterium]|nr:glycoside hydrolase family 3 N-terminal domain-containing protein [Blastocatellia bacterium]
MESTLKTILKYIREILLALICLNLFACLPEGAKARAGDEGQAGQNAWVEKTLASFSLDEKVGQLIVPAIVGMFRSQDSEAFRQVRRDITEFHVGGYLLLGETSTIHEPAGAALLIRRMQEMAGTPLFIAADFEGGVGLRFTGATRLPRAMAVGATADEEMAFQAGRITAREARALGVNVNFYPVVDVNNNARNPIINIRSFGGDPQSVSRMARAYIRGSQSEGVMATAKHFPGHGDTSIDSHLDLPSIDIDRARLDAVELPPFRAAISEGVGAIMSAHIALPRIDASSMPATLSPRLMGELLRKEMGFGGVIFTDAMNMLGIADRYPEGEAAVRAVKAGADVVLFPINVEKSFLALKRAVATGDIPESRVDESVRRILKAKARLGIHKERVADIANLDRTLGSTENQLAARRIIESAITLVRDSRGVLPLRLKPDQRALFISVVDNNEGWRDGTPGLAFQTALRKLHPNVTAVGVSDQTAPAELSLVKKMAALFDVIIVNAFIRVSDSKGSIDMTEGEINLLRHLSSLKKPFAFVLYGSPYLIASVPELPTYVLAYEYYPAAEEAALRAVLGEIEFRGRLPIELPGFYPIGYRK